MTRREVIEMLCHLKNKMAIIKGFSELGINRKDDKYIDKYFVRCLVAVEEMEKILGQIDFDEYQKGEPEKW